MIKNKLGLLFISTSILLAACGNGGEIEDANSEANNSDNEALSFAFLPNTQNNTFQIAMHDTYERLAEENNIEYTMFDPDYDLNTQLNQMSDVASQDFDAVFVIPVDSAGIRQGLESFDNADIPVLNVDTAVIEDDRHLIETIVGTDAYMAGEIMGEELVANNPDGAQIAILDFPENESTVQRVAGFMSVIDDAGSDYEVVAQQDGKAALDASLPIAEDMIQAHPDLDAFFAINDPSALGVTAALSAAGKTGDIEVYSIDASPDGKQALLDGEFTAVAAQVPIQIAEESFELALELSEGNEIDDEIYLPSFNVTDEDAEETIDEWQ